MRRFIAFMTIALVLIAANAMADSIKGRLGVTGQLGFLSPNNSQYTEGVVSAFGLSSDNLKSSGAFTGGGGLFYGLTDHWALEAEALHTPQIDYDDASGAKVLEIATTDVSLGIQFRNNVEQDLAVYLGGGVDVLFSNVKDGQGHRGDIDTVVGGHAKVGVDYFITHYFAINADVRGIFAPEADIKSGGITVAKYDPIAWAGLVGVRLFFY
ncbi:MAG TPA: OmpW family outer membrane protein [Geomonas sp.]|nr:OmpW family outer membrane protein [Geomonas sp.]